MNKTILAASVLIIIAVVAILVLPMPFSQETGPAGTEQEVVIGDSVQVTIDEEFALQDMYIEMLNEEMDSLDMEQTDFNEEMEDSMADDMSQFYYE